MTKEELQGLSEREYHNLPYDSYSTLKTFLNSYRIYYKKYILHEKVEGDEDKKQNHDDMRFGSLVDCIKFSPNQFDDNYTESLAVKPKGQMLDFVENLAKLTKQDSSEFSSQITTSLEERMKKSYDIVGFGRDKFETVVTKFTIDKIGLDYFKELIERGDKIVITSEELEWANSLVDWLNNHPYTKEIFNMTNTDRYEVRDQYKLLGGINGNEIKGMVDRLVIDHDEKRIIPYDLKIMSNINIFAYNYIKLKYYIQNGIYTTLLIEEFPDYIISPVKFIAVDKYRNFDPNIISTTLEQYNDSMYGFKLDGREYKGIFDILKDLKYHKDTNNWMSSKEAIENKGQVILKLSNEIDE